MNRWFAPRRRIRALVFSVLCVAALIAVTYVLISRSERVHHPLAHMGPDSTSAGELEIEPHREVGREVDERARPVTSRRPLDDASVFDQIEDREAEKVSERLGEVRSAQDTQAERQLRNRLVEVESELAKAQDAQTIERLKAEKTTLVQATRALDAARTDIGMKKAANDAARK